MTALTLSPQTARRLWLRAQRLDVTEPFGKGPEATRAAVEHLGYVQIDTINVIERSHHHILFSRIPKYRRADLRQAQSVDKSVFEYWTHALAYVPTSDLRFFVSEMKEHRSVASRWYADVEPSDVARVVRMIRRDGAVSIRDVDNDEDVLVEKDHPWASRKPSKRALQRAFFDGRLVVSERQGMVKVYELAERHFGWQSLPRAATLGQIAEYRLDRALRSQGLISGPSVMHPWLRFSPEIGKIVERRVRRKQLLPVTIEGDATPHWIDPALLDADLPETGLTHILSPFDPLIIQRARLKLFFDYDHIFEAYVPKAKRKFGYFTLPVLHGDKVIAALDLKADRAGKKLLVQAWHWVGKNKSPAHKRAIEQELHRFERFQLASD